MLPLEARGFNYPGSGSFRSTSIPEYLCRVLDYRQMDFEATFDQMLTLMSRNPGRVYKTNFYRKQMKNQWARDDPAFAVVQALFLVAASLAYGIALQVQSLWSYIMLVMRAVFVEWLVFGFISATLCWVVANKQLRNVAPHLAPEQVEWLYAFDIHCNAFFNLFTLLYVLQFFLLPMLMAESYSAMVCSNLLYTLALAVYCYITHLGYRALPFLSRTEVFLYPIGVAVLLLFLSLFLAPFGYNLNATRICMSFYLK